MGAQARNQELARILAEGFLRLMRQRAANHQLQANLGPHNSPELSGYISPLE